MPRISIDKSIAILDTNLKILEYNISKCNFVKSIFPDAQALISKNYVNENVHNFYSKLVDKNYEKYRFVMTKYNLYLVPYTELNYIYNGAAEIITVNSVPDSHKLAQTGWNPKSNKGIIEFSRFTFNMKKNNSEDDFYNECYSQILKFIKNHPDCELNTKHLNPRLKKLLLFT